MAGGSIAPWRRLFPPCWTLAGPSLWGSTAGSGRERNIKTAKPYFSVWRSITFPHKEKSQFGTIMVLSIWLLVNPPRTGGSWRPGFARSASPDSGTQQSKPCRERRGQADRRNNPCRAYPTSSTKRRFSLSSSKMIFRFLSNYPIPYLKYPVEPLHHSIVMRNDQNCRMIFYGQSFHKGHYILSFRSVSFFLRCAGMHPYVSVALFDLFLRAVIRFAFQLLRFLAAFPILAHRWPLLIKNRTSSIYLICSYTVYCQTLHFYYPITKQAKVETQSSL